MFCVLLNQLVERLMSLNISLTLCGFRELNDSYIFSALCVLKFIINCGGSKDDFVHQYEHKTQFIDLKFSTESNFQPSII